MKRQFAIRALGALGALWLTATARADRPTIPALLVPDGAIKIDGRLDDWPGASGAAPYQVTANSADHFLHTRTENGPWRGPADLSATVRAAHDAMFLYLAVQVTDQSWFNAGGSDFPWAGDAIEVYLDANPLASQFQKGTNANFAQFIFVPDHIYEGGNGLFIWRPDKFPGVVAASRLTPVGYTLEVAIPKTVVPNWAANPDLASIGFDIQVDDMDTPGLYGHDVAPKGSLFLLSPFQHFQSAAQLGCLTLDTKPADIPAAPAQPEAILPGYEEAQKILDHFDDASNAALDSALGKPDLARKAAIYILMRRPDLPIDQKQVSAVLGEPVPADASASTLDDRAYAMTALAERHLLNSTEALDLFGQSPNVELRYTALHCAGINGDKSAAPALAKLYAGYTDPRGLEIAAVALAELGDPAGVPALESFAHRDRVQVSGKRDLELLKQLGIDFPAPTP